LKVVQQLDEDVKAASKEMEELKPPPTRTIHKWKLDLAELDADRTIDSMLQDETEKDCLPKGDTGLNTPVVKETQPAKSTTATSVPLCEYVILYPWIS